MPGAAKFLADDAPHEPAEHCTLVGALPRRARRTGYEVQLPGAPDAPHSALPRELFVGKVALELPGKVVAIGRAFAEKEASLSPRGQPTLWARIDVTLEALPVHPFQRFRGSSHSDGSNAPQAQIGVPGVNYFEVPSR